MPASLNSLTNLEVELPIALHGDPRTFTVWYKPHTITPNVEATINPLVKDGWELKSLAEMFIHSVARWDLKWSDTDEQPIPLTTEGLAGVPSDILNEVFKQIQEDRHPDPKKTA